MNKLARFLSLIVLVMVGLCFSVVLAQTETETQQITITSIDADQFPEVAANFRVTDAAGQFVSGLTNFTVAENGQPVADVSVRMNDAEPITVVFVLDLGQYSGTTSISDALLRRAVRQWSDEAYFRDGVDTVSLVVSGGANYPAPTTIILTPSQSLEEFRAAVDGLNLAPGQSSQSLTTLQEVFTQLTELDVQPDAAVYVVYVSRIVDRITNTEAVSLAGTIGAQASELGVPIYVLHTDRDGSYADPFETLATASGGQYLPFSTLNDPDLTLTTLYGNLSASGKSYVATYRSTSGDTAQRTVTVGMAENAALPASANYQVSPAAPTVAITQPTTDFALLRTATEASVGSDNPIFDLDSTTLQFSVMWADGLVRTLTGAELLANGVVAASVTELTPVIDEPAGAAVSATPEAVPTEAASEVVVPVTQTYEITLDLTPFIMEGVTDQSLEVRVTDELGITATSPAITGTLTVELPDVLPAVTLVSPANNLTITRVATLDSSGAITGYDLEAVPLLAQLVWSSATPGEIVTAEILVDGAVVENFPYPTITQIEANPQSAFSSAPEQALSSIELLWDVDDLTAEGANLRDVQIQVRNAAGLTAVSDPITVNVQVSVPDLQLPTVSIISPQGNTTISRAGLPRTGNTLEFQDSGTQDVIAAVSWPDNTPKTLLVAELLFNGLPLGTQSYPTLLTSAEVGSQAGSGNDAVRFFRLPWNISTFSTAGANLGQLQVRVRDIDGFEAVSSAVPVNVQVEIVSPPVITILSPLNNTIITREGQLDRSSATPTFDLNESAVDAVVEWTPQLPFTVTGTDLLVNGTVVGSLPPAGIESANQSLVELPNGRRQLTLSVPWNISSIQTAGANLFQLQVRVRDDAGITAISAPINLNVQVNVPDALPPVVNITSPGNNATLPLDGNQLTVTAETLWSDNQIRSIQFIELSVDGIVRQTLFYPQGTRFSLVWDTGGDLAAGSHQFSVRVRDVAGLEAISPAVTANVEVAIVPTAVAQAEVATAQPETALQPDAEASVESPAETSSEAETTPVVAAPAAICPPTLLEGWDNTECLRDRAIAYLPWVAVAIAAFLFLRRTRYMRPGGIARTIVGVGRKRRPIGRLHIIEGPAARVGQDVNIYTNITTLGRDPRLTDIQLYTLDDESSISAQHCTIRHVRGRFTLMDDNSTNGTQVNGLYINEPVLLSDGDEITIGIPDRMGAVMRFHANVVDMKDHEVRIETPAPTPIPAVASAPVKPTNGTIEAPVEKPAIAAAVPVRSTRTPRTKSIDMMDNILSEIAEKTDKPFRPNIEMPDDKKPQE